MTTAATETRPGPLIEFLGRSWAVGSPVLAAVFNDSTSAVAFALDGGDIALARCDGDDIPVAEAQTNADGVLEITPNEQPPHPLTRVLADARPGISLAADGQGGFLGGDRDGGLFSIGPDGQIVFFKDESQPVRKLSCIFPDGIGRNIGAVRHGNLVWPRDLRIKGFAQVHLLQ